MMSFPWNFRHYTHVYAETIPEAATDEYFVKITFLFQCSLYRINGTSVVQVCICDTLHPPLFSLLVWVRPVLRCSWVWSEQLLLSYHHQEGYLLGTRPVDTPVRSYFNICDIMLEIVTLCWNFLANTTFMFYRKGILHMGERTFLRSHFYEGHVMSYIILTI